MTFTSYVTPFWCAIVKTSKIWVQILGRRGRNRNLLPTQR